MKKNKKINQTGLTVWNLYKSRCKRNCDPSSSWQSLVIVLMQRTALPYFLICWVESHNRRISGTLPPREVFIFLWIRLSTIHKTHFLSSLFSKYHVKKLAYFHEPQLGRISLDIADSVFRLKNYEPKSWIRVAELFALLNHCSLWMIWHFWQLLVFSQPIRSICSSEWLILASFMRVWNMLYSYYIYIYILRYVYIWKCLFLTRKKRYI